uniref:Triokinase/FMN cyclase n=1 Tax=Parastrongyloides trichosuri TaxID=131310 RepID=A0A0N4Z4V7_PARTI
MGKLFVCDIDAAIEGLLNGNEDIIRHKESSRIVMRKEKTSNTALVSGGGSGHEPFSNGLVGVGGLTASICGNLFASPSIKNICTCLNSLNEYKDIIIFVLNYTGDRLSFSSAIEKMDRKDGLHMVVIDDDITHESLNLKTGRRGIGGIILVLKIAGSMCENNCEGRFIAEECGKIINNMSTLGVSEIDEDSLEVGLGIHSEPGLEVLPKGDSKELIKNMISRLMGSERIVNNNCMKVIYINNLGGMSELEVNTLKCFIIDELQNYNNICRVYYGKLMTSLNSNGFSITILNVVDNFWLEELDKKYDTIPLQKIHFQKDYKKEQVDIELDKKMFNKKIEFTLICICDIFMKNIKELNRLDKICGDGDCGDAFGRAAMELLKKINECTIDLSSIKSALIEVGNVFEDVVGGTTGALYSKLLSAMSNKIEIDIIKALEDGCDAIMKFGGAKPGDRTMIDPLYRALITIKKLENRKRDKEFWETVLDNVDKEVKLTATMKASSGRASYTSEKDQNEIDAGAYAVYLWMKAIFEKTFITNIL